MPVDPAFCPADRDEAAEAYVMRTLSSENLSAFEDHLIGCARCVDAVERAAAYVCAVRDAARELRGIAKPTPPKN